MKNNRHFVNYGIDAPTVIYQQLVICVILVATYYLADQGYSWAQWYVGLWGVKWFAVGIAAPIVVALLMLWSSLVGKKIQRDRLLNAIAWRGDEQVLDVGCGRGLMLLGAAKRLTSGKAIGIDKWAAVDLTSNSKQATLANARLEGVADKVSVLDGDACSLPFADNSFDLVLSSFVVHNMSKQIDREQALREMLRVLKPGGYLVVQDFQHTAAHVVVLQAMGASHVNRSSLCWLLFPPARVVTATR